MGDVCSFALTADDRGKSATQVSSAYMGVIIVISCAACFTPIELFLVEIWHRHGFFSLLFFVVPLIAGWIISRLLPEQYYRIKTVELGGRVYEWLGIRFFKRFVPNGDYLNRLIRRSEPDYRVVCDENSIVKFEAGTRLAERCHIVSLLLVLPSAAYALMLDWDKFALWILLPNIPLHLYPVLLQRYTRARIQKVLQRANRRR